MDEDVIGSNDAFGKEAVDYTVAAGYQIDDNVIILDENNEEVEAKIIELSENSESFKVKVLDDYVSEGDEWIEEFQIIRKAGGAGSGKRSKQRDKHHKDKKRDTKEKDRVERENERIDKRLKKEKEAIDISEQDDADDSSIDEDEGVDDSNDAYASVKTADIGAGNWDDLDPGFKQFIESQGMDENRWNNDYTEKEQQDLGDVYIITEKERGRGRLSSKRIAKSPPGWEKTTEDMKKHKEIDNPFALSWWMKNKGYKPNKESAYIAKAHIAYLVEAEEDVKTAASYDVGGYIGWDYLPDWVVEALQVEGYNSDTWEAATADEQQSMVNQAISV